MNSEHKIAISSFYPTNINNDFEYSMIRLNKKSRAINDYTPAR